MSTLSNKAHLFRFYLTVCQRRLNNRHFASNIHKSTSTANSTQSSQESKQKQKQNVGLATIGVQKYDYVMEVPEGLFRGVVDRFNGITVDSGAEFVANINFADKLQKSIDYWIENGRRGIWFKVLTEHSDWVPELTKRQFDFHHAKNGYVMLYRWLPKTESANIPVYAHTLLGVGGLVVNDKNEILVVSDRYALIPNSWKLPGGYVEPKENLVEAAIREVREETGIETSFDTVVSVRQSHGGSFGCSDLYFVIALKPSTSRLVACPREISKVQWMPVAEYLEHPHVHETNRQFVRTFLHYKEEGLQFNCVSATHQNGFDFHHAKNGYVMMHRGLSDAKVPVYAHTLVTVGGLVVNDKNEVLTVSDRFALIPNSWKLPGGYVEPQEDLVEAVKREVFEETGVETSFDSLISVRHAHGACYGCSDLYFVIALKPITTQLVACPREICKLQWMPVPEFLENPNVYETNRQVIRTFFNYKEMGLKFNCVSAVHKVLNRKYCLYSVEKPDSCNNE